MFMDGKNQYCQDVSSLQLHLRFNTILIKTSVRYFVDIDELFLKFICKSKRLRTTNTRMKKNKVERKELLNYDHYYKAMMLGQCGTGERIRLTNGIAQRAQKQTHTYSQVIFDKGARSVEWYKNSLWQKQSFQQMVLEQLDIHIPKKKKKQILYLL